MNDLTSSDDRIRITVCALSARRPADFIIRTGWPRQELPTATQGRLWKRYISSQFLRYDRYWKTPPRLRGSSSESQSEPPPGPKSVPILESIRELPRFNRRLLQHVCQKATDEEVWEACNSRSAITFATDGGLKGRTGTFGWHMSNDKNETLFEGTGPVDGPYDVANSTRCELGGIAAALLFYRLLLNQWGTRPTCTYHDDTTSILRIAYSSTKKEIARTRLSHRYCRTGTK